MVDHSAAPGPDDAGTGCGLLMIPRPLGPRAVIDNRAGVDQIGSPLVLPGEPVVGQMPIDPGRLDRPMPGLRLDRFQRHARLPETRQTRVAQLMARRPLEPSPTASPGQDLVETFGRQRLSPPRTFQDHEETVGRRHWPFPLEVLPDSDEEPLRHRHHPLVAAFALGHEDAPIGDMQIGQTQSKDLAPAQPT